MNALFTLLCCGWRSYLVGPNEIKMVEGKLSLASILSMVVESGAHLGIKNGQPVLVGAVPPYVLEGLSEHRDAIRDFLLSGTAAEFENLVCSRCKEPTVMKFGPYRFCSDHGSCMHYLRSPE